jgi:glutaryl-CoA dehydrogenase
MLQAIAWGVTGAALSCYEAALQFSMQKRLPGTPESLTPLADMAAQIVTSQLLSLHYGRCSEMGQLTPLQV